MSMPLTEPWHPGPTPLAQVNPGTSRIRMRHSVAIRDGCRPTFYCMHPVSGDVSALVPLAMASPRHFVAVEALGLRPGETPMHSIDDMARCYGAEIMQAATGPSPILGGWSMGGLISWTVGVQLQHKGFETQGLVLIDSADPNREGAHFKLASNDIQHMFVRDVWLRAGKSPTLVLQGMESQAQPERLAWLIGCARTDGIASSDWQQSQLARLYATCCAHYEAMADFRTDKRYRGNVLLLQASAHGQRHNDLRLDKWKACVDGVTTRLVIEGDHYSIVSGHRAMAVAAAIEHWLLQGK